MSISETLFTARFRSGEEIERARTQVLTCPVFRAGALVVPLSGTITIYKADSTALVNAAPVVIVGSMATYTLNGAATTSLQLEDGWLIEWTLAMSASVTNTFRNDAALVRRTLYPVITDADLFRRHSDLPALLATGVSSYQEYLDEAWATIVNRITSNGRRPYLVIQPSALRDCHLALTLQLVFIDFQTSAGDGGRWQALAEHYGRAYTDAWAQLRFTYDESDENKVSTSTKKSAASQVWTNGRGQALGYYPRWN
jgi:hypothetical protein